MRGDVIVTAVGLVVALAFSNLVQAFTDNVIDPLVAAAQGGDAPGLGVQLGAPGNAATFLDLGALISAVVYFLVFMAVVYFVIVVPYRGVMRRRGRTVFGAPEATKTCPACLSDDLPTAARRCKYCATDQPPTEAASTSTTAR